MSLAWSVPRDHARLPLPPSTLGMRWGGETQVSWGLVGAFAAAIAYGTATVLQAMGARATERATRPDARLLWRLAHSMPYVAGLVLDGFGFALSLAALRSEPLFTVQAIVSASLAWAAILSVLLLGSRLLPTEWGALALTTVGLALLAISAAERPATHVTRTTRLELLVAVLAVAVVVLAIARRSGEQAAGRFEVWTLGTLAGTMYGAGGIGARVLAQPHSPRGLLVDPALWAMLVAGVLGLMLQAMALQRGGVAAVTSAVVIAETLLPAAVGVFLLGDRPASGRTLVAVLGFVAAVAGSLLLSRHGAPATAPASADPAAREQSPEPCTPTAG
jgi:drug/metabolite transporter (DMT)-like permease